MVSKIFFEIGCENTQNLGYVSRGTFPSALHKNLRKAGESMKSSIIKTKDELPMFLTVMDMAALLGISRSSAYELAAEEGFPKLRFVPGRVIIPRDKLFDWLDEQTSFGRSGERR